MPHKQKYRDSGLSTLIQDQCINKSDSNNSHKSVIEMISSVNQADYNFTSSELEFKPTHRKVV